MTWSVGDQTHDLKFDLRSSQIRCTVKKDFLQSDVYMAVHSNTTKGCIIPDITNITLKSFVSNRT